MTARWIRTFVLRQDGEFEEIIIGADQVQEIVACSDLLDTTLLKCMYIAIFSYCLPYPFDKVCTWIKTYGDDTVIDFIEAWDADRMSEPSLDIRLKRVMEKMKEKKPQGMHTEQRHDL